MDLSGQSNKFCNLAISVAPETIVILYSSIRIVFIVLYCQELKHATYTITSVASRVYVVLDNIANHQVDQPTKQGGAKPRAT